MVQVAHFIFTSVCSVMSLCEPHGLESARFLCPWDFPGKNIGVGCHFLLQEIFPTQGSNTCLLHLLHCRQILLLLNQWGSPPPHFILLDRNLLMSKERWPSGKGYKVTFKFHPGTPRRAHRYATKIITETFPTPAQVP